MTYCRLSPLDSDVNMPVAPPASMATTYKMVDGTRKFMAFNLFTIIPYQS